MVDFSFSSSSLHTKLETRNFIILKKSCSHTVAAQLHRLLSIRYVAGLVDPMNYSSASRSRVLKFPVNTHLSHP